MYEYTMIFCGTIHQSKIKKCGKSSVVSFFRRSTEVDHWTTHESTVTARNDKFRMVWKDDSFITSRLSSRLSRVKTYLDGCKQNIPFLDPKKVLECNETRLLPTKKGVTQGNGNWTHNMWVFPVDAENWSHRRRSLICKPVHHPKFQFASYPLVN